MFRHSDQGMLLFGEYSHIPSLPDGEHDAAFTTYFL